MCNSRVLLASLDRRRDVREGRRDLSRRRKVLGHRREGRPPPFDARSREVGERISGDGTSAPIEPRRGRRSTFGDDGRPLAELAHYRRSVHAIVGRGGGRASTGTGIELGQATARLPRPSRQKERRQSGAKPSPVSLECRFKFKYQLFVERDRIPRARCESG